MSDRLRITAGQHTDAGRKDRNQDFHGLCIPSDPLLAAKGIAAALADGIGSSQVSHIASESAVAGFLEDYYCTPDAWSVKESARRVLAATNSWLHAQTSRSRFRYDKDKGYVCTFSALVLKSATAHIFHVGDSRVYRSASNVLEQLTQDHRLWVSREHSYLSRALGIKPQLEIDYLSLPVEAGDVFILTTDGVHEFVDGEFLLETLALHAADLDEAARVIVARAHANGSPDNLTVQLLRVEALPGREAGEFQRRLEELELPPLLQARMEFDGYRVLRELHIGGRSHVHLAVDPDTGERVALKIPSIDRRGDPAYLERFLAEEWIARRLDSPHVLASRAPSRRRRYLYIVTEFIEGQTLAQWMIDHPAPDLATVRGIVEQIARGLRAFHRLEMLHQDLRPHNVMIDAAGTVKIIDFGSVRVAGMLEDGVPAEEIPGTAAYAAPEYFLGETPNTRSDLYSLGVITYQMLDGGLPYGTNVAGSRTRAAQNRLRYRPLRRDGREIPAWIDDVLRKAVHPQPGRRHEALSEFLYDLRNPRRGARGHRPALLERDPLRFWQCLSAVLGVAVIVLLLALNGSGP